ncbi:MFS transporter [Kitasatospora viridis]|uniref:DHA2 family multidrug resistance protein-like MFS transporter n=1 Tax=Kitasatospora viridis TaxID=281105 RepID=A0A561ULM8_9ACTN|nr:MFS transporter [Kitasatospora viridis]TWG00234.1 DHA2 family multidrug resistance protein-like MFS transporter [Kitasatospora viridis]
MTRHTAARRPWLALGVLMLPLLLVSMDVSVLYFAVPFISQDLHPSSTQQLWIFDMYGFVLAGLLLTMGALGDRIGRRRLLLLGALGFGAASTLAAYSTSAATLIAARAVLGVAGATLMPSTLGMIRNLFTDEKERGKAIAVWTAVTSGGIAVGPVLSGLLLEHFWWGSVFLINLPAMVLLLVLGPLLLPETPRIRGGRFDLLSALLSLATVLPLIYGIKELARNGLAPLSGAAIAVGLLVGLVFVRRQLTHPDALIDLALVRSRGFGVSIGLNMLGMFGLVGMAIFLTQYLQLVRGMSPLTAALWSVLPSLAVGAMAAPAAVLGRRFGKAPVIAGGLALMAAGFGLLTATGAHGALWQLLLAASIYAGGGVALMSQVSEVVMAAAPTERAGTASALLESGTELGGALGMAVLGSVGTALYRSKIGSGPAGVPDALRGAVRDSLGGTEGVLAQLPAAVRGPVLAAAREAFCGGMQGAALVSAVLMALGALAALAARRSLAVRAPAAEESAREAVTA